MTKNLGTSGCVLIRIQGQTMELCLSTFGRKWGLGLVTWQDVVHRSPRCPRVKVYVPRGRYLGGAWCSSLPSYLIPYPSSIRIGLGIPGSAVTICACPSSCSVGAQLSCWSRPLQWSCPFGLGFSVVANPCRSGSGVVVSSLVLL